MNMKVKVKKLHNGAILPEYSTTGAACFDLFYCPTYEQSPSGDCIIPNNESGILETGLSFEIPDGYVMVLCSRSGMGFSRGLRLANSVGVIDSDYRGEVKLKIHNDSIVTRLIESGDKIAQGMIVPVERINFIEVDELSKTERGDGGFGSTGK